VKNLMKADTPRKRRVQARNRQDPEGPPASPRVTPRREPEKPERGRRPRKVADRTTRASLGEEKPMRAAASSLGLTTDRGDALFAGRKALKADRRSFGDRHRGPGTIRSPGRRVRSREGSTGRLARS
jgi:hypothetical protein